MSAALIDYAAQRCRVVSKWFLTSANENTATEAEAKQMLFGKLRDGIRCIVAVCLNRNLVVLV